jgi:hypothetical protein
MRQGVVKYRDYHHRHDKLPGLSERTQNEAMILPLRFSER